MISDDTAKLDAKALVFLEQTMGAERTIRQVAGDASFRRYFRVTTPEQVLILMDAPPEKEDSQPFVNICRFLRSHGVPTPKIYHEDLANGYLLLEDFGDITLLGALQLEENPQHLYTLAIETLLDIQATPNDGRCVAHARPYDWALLSRELALFTDWYLEGICQRSISANDRQVFQEMFALIIEKVLTQPQVFVHRDYHSRNLMWHNGTFGVIDFQDAVMGPITYDLASLLRDCYVAWDLPFRTQCSELWRQGARQRLGYHPDPKEFIKDFDWMALQRNLKAIGIFGRLSLRDGKHGYLQDIPRTLTYVYETLPKYPELAALQRLVNFYTSRPS